MPHRPLSLANEFIRQFGGLQSIDHLKLQKLTYFAQGWWLAGRGSALLTERPQVWRFGPVFSSLYHIFSGRGSNKIIEPSGNSPFGTGAPPVLEGEEFNRERELVTWIWAEYGALTGPQLSDLTHAPGTPWHEIAKESNFRVPVNTPIPEAMDWKYFAGLAAERGIQTVPLNG